MKIFISLFILIFLLVPFSIGEEIIENSSKRPIHTYSIMARDPDTSQLGVAVQSHWFSAGAIVTLIEAGVRAVATQCFVEVSYGPLGLDLMRAGKSF